MRRHWKLAAAIMLAVDVGIVFAQTPTVQHAITSAGLNISITDAFTLASVIIAQLATAGAVYGGIKSDLRAMHERIESLKETASRAHERVDDLYERMGERRK